MPKKAKEDTIKVTKETIKKEVKVKGTSNTQKASKTTQKKSPSASSKTASTAKKTTTRKKSSSSTTKTATSKKQTKKKVDVVEYYDLPYRYNQTVVKILAQTPSTLFVYWDISDEDKNKYIEQYGEYFFNNTKPVLIVHNKTKKYSYEIDINDFANSWYLHLADSNCDYEIELGRRPINQYINISNNYLHVTTSNNLEVPNDHILVDALSNFVYFKNVKTNETLKKNINLNLLYKVGTLSSVSAFYKKMYPEEMINFDRFDLQNPSSK